jgi:hypothetical protein
MLVDFMLIGAQKSGTTSLSYQIAQHSEVVFCKNKEPDYFSKSPEWSAHIQEYHSLYEYSNGKIYGEASTTYTWLPEYPDTAPRLYAYNPNLKFIYIMRQPVDRVVSHYTHHLLKARTKYAGDREVFEDPAYVNHSRYAVQLRPYLELFSANNILLIIFEEYVRHPRLTLNHIADHIGVRRDGFDGIDLSPQYLSMNRTGDKKIKKWLSPLSRIFPVKVRNALRGPFVYKLESKVDLPLDTKRILWRLLEDDVQEIEKILGRPLDVWRQPPYLPVTGQ